ncbi:MAG TPA: hypothetical protein VMR33_00480 [Candidatus Baltobacteraceae bacterium]|jgi:hypothetical protein|nr:hypothetical protein [Candidatus Baltobacteraceae bacterium]
MSLAEITATELGTWLYGAATVAQLAATVTVLITINSKQRREVSFAGEPLDRKEFDKHVAENAATHSQLYAKIGGAERGVESRVMGRLDKLEAESRELRRLVHQEISAIGNDVASLKKEAELANQRVFQMDSKIDRLIERNQ